MLGSSSAPLAGLLLALLGCGAREHIDVSSPPAPAPLVIRQPEAYAGNGTSKDERATNGAGSGQEILLTGPLAAAPAIRKVRHGFFAEEIATNDATATPTPPGPIPVKPARSTRVELFDIEAKVQLEVPDVSAGRARLVALTAAFSGQLMNEVVEDGANQRGASLSLRIPSERARPFVARLGEVGKVRSSTLETHEHSRSLADAEVLEQNLELALTRYETLLAQAANVAEATALETELLRVRTQLDRVQGDLAWTRDRAARSTVYVTLALAPDHGAFEPAAKFYPGLRTALLVDVPPNSFAERASVFAGGGFSLQFTRTFDIDLDLLNDLGEARGTTVDFYVLSLGTAFYSDYFGGGQRRAMNPYFGFRTGYAHAPSQSLFALGGTLGIELYKSEFLLLGLEARAYALLGRQQGPDFALEPALGMNLAY